MIPVRIVLAGIFVWLFCQGAGELLFRALGLKLPRKERIFLAFLTGAALVSTLMFALAAGQLAYTRIIIIAGLITVAAWIWFCRPNLRDWRGLSPELPWYWQAAFWGPLAVYGCLYLLTALAPETDADGPVYHVGLITRYYEHRGFYPIYNMFAGLGEGIEMLFWIGFAIGKHSAASMVAFVFLLAAPFGMAAYGERAGYPRAGVVGALLFYMAPVVGKAGTIPYVDVATGVVVFGTFYLLQIWREENNPRVLALAGLMAGFCFACKITASTMVIYAVLFALGIGIRRRGWRGGLRAAWVVAGFACVTAVPWIAKNAIVYHNPFWPLFNHWFPNPYQYEMVENELRQSLAHTNNVSYARVPWELAVGGELYGIVGPTFLIAPFALLSLRRPAGRQLWIAFAFLALPLLTNTGARFFIPALPFLSMALALALIDIPLAGTAIGMAALAFHAWSSWPGVVERHVPGFQWRIDPVNVAADLRLIPEDRFLGENWRDYRAGQLLDRYVPAGDLVFSPSMGQIAYHHRQIVGTFDSTSARRAWTTLLAAMIPFWANKWHRDIRFAAVETERVRLQCVEKMDRELRISEMRFYNGETEIPRAQGWRLTASRNPWEVQLAFDNDFWSWWTSGAPIEPGTWIEVDFGRALRLDRIAVDQVEDQRAVRLQLVAWVGGQWKALEAQESGVLSPPSPDFRMELADELKSMGIRWILCIDESPEGTDLRTKSPQWGIDRIAAVNGYSLYKLR